MSTLVANQSFVTALVAIMQSSAVLIAAAAAYLVVRTKLAKQGQKIDDLKEQVNAGGGASPTTVVAVPPAGGAGSVPLRAPAWNQLNDPLPDGLQDPYATTNCGEESVAMAIAACGGPELPAGVLRVLLGGIGRAGMSTAAELVYLLSLFHIKAHTREAEPDAAWVEWQHSYKARYLAIALGYWVQPSFRHWVLVREADAGHITVNDPWGGQVKVYDKQTAQRLYCGVYVHIDQPVSAPAPAPPRDG